MIFEDLEELLRKYLSTGIAVVIILAGPGTGAEDGEPGARTEPSVEVIEPGGRTPEEPDPTGRTGAAGTDPDRPERDRDRAADPGPADPEPTDPEPAEPADREPRDRAPADPEPADPEPGEREARDPEPADPEPADRDDGAERGGPTGEDRGDDDGPGDARDTGDRETAADRDTADGPDEHEPGATDRSGGDADRDTDEPDASTRSNRTGTADTEDGSGEDGSGEGATAAERYGWGTPNRVDDFSGGSEQWDIYDGPGHAGKGIRSPDAVSIEGGILTITGDSSGTTAGMAWNPGQKYGRWEGRVKAPASDPSYNALLLLWADAEDFPVGGEIDFMEMLDHTRQTTDIFIHYGADNSQVNGQVEIDGTEWHNWAVEWTPEAITAYVDGEEWYRTTDTSIFPPGPMHLCIQLDWFPEGGPPEESVMHVDWVKQYSLEDGAADAGNGDGADRDDDRDDTDRNEGRDGTDGENGAKGEDGTDGEDASATAEGRDGADGESRNEGDREDDEREGSVNPIREAVRRTFSWG
ncbi:family 16 glycosylhydrolase [Pseudonocardia nigra]|uniref:family 16 glycosylhydrolase n=1 Tax=Pseudonocardia nigra TaxID=1921578 RepID=UPI001C5E8EE7|nr:family 16 glycosylhydrolase [Pseudonocardia nigra]